MEPNTLCKAVGAVVLGLLGFVFLGLWSAMGGAILGYVAGPPLAKKLLNARERRGTVERHSSHG